MSIRIYGATSGYVDLDAPAVAGSASVTLPGSGTLATQAYADGLAGLTLITTQTFSAVASVSVNNCFSSTYLSYRIVIRITGVQAQQPFMRLRVSGTDATTNYGTSGLTSNTGSGAASTIFNNGGVSNWALIDTTATGGYVVMDIHNPFSTEYTWATWQAVRENGSSGVFNYAISGFNFNSTSYDGFSLIAQGANTITGTVRVYGYRN